MRTIQAAMPRPEFREFVRAYAEREITCEGAGFAQANIAVLEQVIDFELGDRRLLDFPDGRSQHSSTSNA